MLTKIMPNYNHHFKEYNGVNNSFWGSWARSTFLLGWNPYVDVNVKTNPNVFLFILLFKVPLREGDDAKKYKQIFWY